MTKEWEERTVYHLHLNQEDKDEYYGSMSAMYRHHDRDLGIAITSLTNYFNKCRKEGRENFYNNALCSIRKAPLVTYSREKT